MPDTQDRIPSPLASAQGLTAEEVHARQQQGLVNVAQEKNTKRTGQIISDNVFTLFNAFNLIIALLLAWVHAWTNMLFFAIIVLNACIGIVQEIRAKKLVENLSLLSALKIAVIRGGITSELPVEDLVLDDLIVLSMGSQVCADSTVMQGEIEVNESLLTGEADPILKRPGDALLSGSFVVSGNCQAKVDHVGADNFVAKLAQGAKKHRKVNSELLTSMQKVTRFTGFFIVPIGILLFIEAYVLRADSTFHSVVSTSAALLGMLPKGLVLIISISLAAGVIKLSKKKILVQEMHSIETLAHVDMLCLDKTGTLTQGKMCVSEVNFSGEEALSVAPEVAISAFIGALQDNNATFMALQEHFGADSSYQPLNTTPFSSQRKWSGATFEDLGTIVLGAPEIFQGFALSDAVEQARQSGTRVVCFAQMAGPLTDEAPSNAVPFAAICLDDPVRDSARETLEFFKHEGVDIKIISGDNALTVSHIAEEVGFENADSFIDLSDLKTNEELCEAAAQHSIFGRVTPDQKRQLIKAFQAQGHTVAMTGDGVNDVLALREADCSIAMASGSDAAKQVSQIVLVQSDFALLPDVLIEGRRVVNNITRIAGIFFIKTIYSVLLAVFALVTLAAFPFIPLQITLIDAVIEAFPGFFLSFEPSKKKPRGAFLPTVLGNASTYAVLILFCFLCLTGLSYFIKTPGFDVTTTLYYAIGTISLAALVLSCRPFNAFRVILCAIAAAGFYGAVAVFYSVLSLKPLAPITFIVLIPLMVICVPLGILLKRVVNKVLRKRIGGDPVPAWPPVSGTSEL